MLKFYQKIITECIQVEVDKLLTVSRLHQAMAIRWCEHVDEDRSRSAECDRMDLVVVVDRDQRASDKVTVDIRLVSVEQRLLERLVSMHLVLLIVLCLPECRVYRAGRLKLSCDVDNK